jgi:hypothetical protein
MEKLKRTATLKFTHFKNVCMLLTIMSLLGCVAAIPAVIIYHETHKGFAVTAQLDVPADKIFQTALDIIKENPGKYTLVEKDAEKRHIKVDAKYPEGIHKTVIKVTRIDANRSQVMAVSDTPGDSKADETGALAAVRVLCDRLGVKYELIKG